MSDASPAKISLTEALERLLHEPVPYALLYERGDVAIEFFAPRGRDRQMPHDQDEIYLVLSGTAVLLRGGERIPCGAGDVLFVPARTEHRFETFSADFRTWVVYFGSHAPPR